MASRRTKGTSTLWSSRIVQLGWRLGSAKGYTTSPKASLTPGCANRTIGRFHAAPSGVPKRGL